jgi:predicted Ser/Thr protein kinase
MSVRYHSVGPFEIVCRLGSGGMADVLKAVDGRDGRTVALKIPRHDRGVREAEREGALIQMKLSEMDPRVPRVFEIDETADEMYIAMEYVAGEDLSERIRRGPLEPREAVRIARELCELLCTAQRFTRTVEERTHVGIVHGDLKPRNVRLEPGGNVKVLDFGIAKALSLTRPLTRNEFGSLPYSSPERIETGLVDAHSDLWSVSVVLYEMLSGKQPFRGESTRRLEDFIRSRARPDEMPADCPPALAAILRKALAPALERRYASAAAMRDDLVTFLEGGPPLALAENGVAAAYEATRRTSANGHAEHDPGATRRTVAAESGATEDTRRTLANAGAPAAGAVPAIPATGAMPATVAPLAATEPATARTLETVVTPGASGPRPIPSQPPLLRRVRWRMLAILIGVFLIANEAQVMGASGELKGALPRLPRGESDGVWTRFRQLRSRSFLRVGTAGLAGDVKQWFVSSADELIADYRSDTPVIRENGWRESVALLERAASISPGDRAVRARLHYCRGHLARIDAMAAKERRPADARRLFNTATNAFQEAARLRPRWADPHLGLARTQVYGLEDPDAARAALERAERDGYEFGNRDMALLGDGHRLRAEKTWASAPDWRDLPQEDEYLERVREDCRLALEHYESVPAYGEVSRSLRKVQALIDKVEARERALRDERLRKAGLGFITPFLSRGE